MMASAVKVIVMIVAVIAMVATVSVDKGMIVVSVVLLPMSRIIIFPVRRSIVLIMTMMMWKIDITRSITMIIMIRPFAVIVSVHNGIPAAVCSIARIIPIMPCIRGASTAQQRKTDKQHFFGDRVHFV